MEKEGPDISTFKGMPAVVTRGVMAGTHGALITHSTIFRVPGGTFMLGIVTPKDHETQSLQQLDRFYNSISFNRDSN
jgi:hypothetical protein